MRLYYFVALALIIKPTWQELVWEELTTKSGSISPRRDAAIAYQESEDAVYIFGGKSVKNRALDNNMYKFDLNTKIWTVQINNRDVPNARFSMVYGTKGNYFYIATGEDIDSSGKSTYYDDFWRFHFPTSKWEEMSSNNNKPKKRSSASGGIHEDDSSFVLSHGSNDDDKFSNTFSYDIDQPASTRAWEEIHSGTNNYNPSYPHARYQQAGLMVSKDKLLLFGGCLSGQGTGGPCPSDDSWTYDKASNEWSELNRCSSPKISPAMARLPSGNTSIHRVVLWGGNADSRTTLASDDDKEDEIAVFDPDKNEWKIKKTQV
ncbi:ferric-chelate reductase 1 [Paramuricea clavata]|uniref:Ferric-chelate reductase 1 n=1 Tax=Paramuricea clavata TaxID=317549 RepID=A0A6S7GKF9_PARCT|nr:ferric-chelate reductase 1 [Paramuricea clavata]